MFSSCLVTSDSLRLAFMELEREKENSWIPALIEHSVRVRVPDYSNYLRTFYIGAVKETPEQEIL